MTDESEDMDDIPKSDKGPYSDTRIYGNPEHPEPKKPEEECDPLTMNCNEMPKMMETLIRKESILSDGIEKINELKKTFPNRKELDSLHDDVVSAKDRIHGTISDITTRFSMCTLKDEKPEEAAHVEAPVEDETSSGS